MYLPLMHILSRFLVTRRGDALLYRMAPYRTGTVQLPYCPCGTVPYGTVRYGTCTVPYGTGTIPYGTVPVPYRTVPYRYHTVRYHTGNTATVRYLYGTAPYGTITRHHVVLLKTATIYAAIEDADIYVKFLRLIKCRCCPIDHRAAMDELMSCLRMGFSPGFHD